MSRVKVYRLCPVWKADSALASEGTFIDMHDLRLILRAQGVPCVIREESGEIVTRFEV